MLIEGKFNYEDAPCNREALFNYDKSILSFIAKEIGDITTSSDIWGN